MQSVSSMIWTRVAVSISYDDNHYTTITDQPWTSMSFDSNPIENLWQELFVRQNRRSPKNLMELKRVTIEEWK